MAEASTTEPRWFTRGVGAIGADSFFSDAGHELTTSVLPQAETHSRNLRCEAVVRAHLGHFDLVIAALPFNLDAPVRLVSRADRDRRMSF